MERDLALRLVADRPWHHEFEIVPGVRTKGDYDPEPLWRELRLPDDLAGMSVADVGASNGYFSFEARRRRARVVAFDFRHKDNSGFGLAQHINGMHDIEHHQINVLEIRPETFGQFDIVLALGLVYHTADPYRALANCAALSRHRLLIESSCIDGLLPDEMRLVPLMKFMPDPERFPMRESLNADRSHYWGFTSACLQRMVEDVGFVSRRIAAPGADRVLLDCERVLADESQARLHLAYETMRRVPVGENPDDPGAWVVY